MRYILLENHPADSRVKILDDNICQTLSSRMGTGGHQISISDYTAIVLEIYELSESNRFFNGEQSSRQLLWSGRIQRHVGDGECGA